MALEANMLQENMAVEANSCENGKVLPAIQKLDCIYDEEPLGFEKDPSNSSQKMQAQDPLEEIDIGDGSIKRPTYISANIPKELRDKLVELLKEFKDCFAWDYNEMSGLNRNLVEHRLPIRPDKKPVKQSPRRFAPEILSKIKEEIERLLRSKFIRTARYVEWLANIVLVIKKNGSLRICIDFRDLNNATPKDEYSMPVAEMLIDSAAGFEYLSMLDGYSGYNQIFIAEEDVAKTAFRCPGALGTYEWEVMPFGDFLGFVVHKKVIEINQNKTKAILETKPPTNKKQLQSLLGKINFLRRFISNLRASGTTLGSMLAQEDESGEEKAIYYLSRVFNDVETRYSSIKKLCLCLYFSCMKLKHYIKPIDVYVYSHYDIIKHMLLKPILHSRIGRWALALSEYSLSYKPLKAIKGQIVADFIVDHSEIESPQNYVGVEPWILYFDGSKHQHGLEILLSLGAKDIKIKGDSELVLKQLTKEYKCIKEHLIRYFVIANTLLKRFDSIDIEHVPRIENQEANDLAQIASGYKVSKEKLEQLVEIKEKLISKEPMQLELSMPKLVGADTSHNDINNFDPKIDHDVYDEFQIFVIDNLVNGNWRKPIVEYLENPIGNAPRKIKYRASNYVIIGNELFKKTLEGILLKCVSETEAYIAISDVHSGACGSHQSGHKMK
ncbi:uncharacterized protein LOC123914912 [Trifolium pratense]|uniref:uncharacterized protein LOC123914912 n=1 Tax=Trifolium pratense TaxID=57577 RepID=UPI001E6965E2|nr:uncharacterized protein LOC123914912 [Trifolium pratense]